MLAMMDFLMSVEKKDPFDDLFGLRKWDIRLKGSP